MRKPTPTAILQLRGSFDAHPERLRDRAGEPKSSRAVGPAPRWLNSAQRACYRELVAKAHPGTLGQADQFVVEMAAVLLEQMRRDPGIPAARLARLQSLLASMGMSPSDRSRIDAAKAASDGHGFDFK